MKTVKVTLKFTIPDSIDSKQVEQIVTDDLKRAMRIFGMIKGVQTEVVQDIVEGEVKTYKPKRVRGRRIVA